MVQLIPVETVGHAQIVDGGRLPANLDVCSA
jgi:hypothetical protein